MRLTRTIVSVFVLSFAYAIVRYVVFKGVAPERIPLYVLNKAVSMLALFLLGLSFVARTDDTRRGAGLAAAAAAGLHGLVSLVLWTPAYYGKFFASDGSLTRKAEASLLLGTLGVTALVLLAWPHVAETRAAWTKARRWLVPALLAAAGLHTGLMGWAGWWTPSHWPGFLPPITLLSSVFAAGALALGLARRFAGSSAGGR